MDYFALKHLHMGFALSSGALFLVRGLLMLGKPAALERRWAKILPHVVDTLLLVTAIILAVWSSQYPFVAPWLTAKVLALVAYIVLGTIALKRGRTKQVRVLAFIGALGCFAYIVGVAITKNPHLFA